MDISIVIVSWNVRELLYKCLESIRNRKDTLQIEVFVVDNNSHDGSAEMVTKDFPEVRLIANHDNKGFSGANNQAIKEATGKYILLLNPDTEIFTDTLSSSLAFMETHLDCGIMGCQMLNSDLSLQPSVRRFPVLWPIALMFLKAPKIFPNIKPINNYLATDFDYNREQEVDQVMGAFMMVRRQVFDRIGFLDEDFFVWFEEVDFCKRCWSGGFSIYYFPGVKVIHHGGQSFGQQKMVRKQMQFFKSAWLYFKKNGFNNKKR